MLLVFQQHLLKKIIKKKRGNFFLGMSTLPKELETFSRSTWSMFIMAKNEQTISTFGVKAYKIHYISKCSNTCIKKLF